MLKIRSQLPVINKLCSFKHFCEYSTQPVIQEKSDNAEDQLKEFQRISNIQRKVRTKKPQKPPFVKNFFLGVFDTDLLAYPELNNEDLNNLNSNVKPIETYLQNEEIAECGEISGKFLKKLAKERLLGLQASQLMGGRELTATEMCRFFEPLSQLNLKNEIVNNEVLGIQTIIKYGSETIKRKYLQRLIEGDSLSAFCILEPLPSQTDVFRKTATKSGDGKSWVINGQKNFVTNASDADLYVIVASSDYVIKDEIREHKYTVFIAERDAGGVTSTRKMSLDGGRHLSNVIFENTIILSENVIGNENDGENILTAIYPEYRLSVGLQCSTLLKNLINKMTSYYIQTSREPYFLYESDAITIRLGEFQSSLYAIDSMTYMTSLLIDDYENQDTELEAAIVKVFASEHALRITSACLDLLGPEACEEGHWCNKFHKDALCQVMLNDSNANLKILIALFGLRHAGKEVNELVKKLRNPLFHSATVLGHMWKRRRQASDNPSLNLYLYQYLHPSCMQAAKRLEYCVLRLNYATEILFSQYGPQVINRHVDLTRLADAVIDIYAMAASLSRASRSYCIGLQHADCEMTLAASFALQATNRIKANLQPLIDGPLSTCDDNMRFLSKRLFKFKQYYPVHPLSRNF